MGSLKASVLLTEIFETHLVFSWLLKRSVTMVKIIKFVILFITIYSLPYAEASKFTTGDGKFECDENICEFKKIDDIGSSSMYSSKKLSDVVNNMVGASKGQYHYNYHTEPVAWKNFTDISFKNSHVEEIPSILFETFSGLIKFEAVDVRLKGVNRDDFKFASSLQHIDLSRNMISYLPTSQVNCLLHSAS